MQTKYHFSIKVLKLNKISMFFLLFLCNLTAENHTNNWKYYVIYQNIYSSMDVKQWKTVPTGYTLSTGISNKMTGIKLGVERRFYDRIGFNLSLLCARPKGHLQLEGANLPKEAYSKHFSLISFSISPDFYLISKKRIDVYTGPLWGYAIYTMPYLMGSVHPQVTYGSNNEITFGGKIGVNFNLNKNFQLKVEYSYLWLNIRIKDTYFGNEKDEKLNPKMIGIGFVYNKL